MTSWRCPLFLLLLLSVTDVAAGDASDAPAGAKAPANPVATRGEALPRPSNSTRTAAFTHASWQSNCNVCHDVRGAPGNTNLSKIRRRVLFPAATTPVDFTRKPEGFAADASPWNGICEVCHTSTKYYRRDGRQPYNHGHTGEDCATCHPHKDGFAPSGSCLVCHSVAQGSRRAVSGEFSLLTDNHAHVSAANGQPSDSDCTVCHDQTTHKDGYVDLYNPDGGAGLRFATASSLTSDPDLSTFCMNCHDSDGARRMANPTDPFGSGNRPPDIATLFRGTATSGPMPGSQLNGYATPNTHHDISNADQARSGGKVECTNCHNGHSSSASHKVANPRDTSQTANYGTTDEKVAFCLACHDGSPPPQSVQIPSSMLDMRGWLSSTGNAWTNGNARVHGGATMRGVGPNPPSAYGYLSTAGDRQIPLGVTGRTAVPAGGVALACDVCHDPHGSTYTDRSWNGNIYALRNTISSEYQQYDNGAEDGIGRWLWPQTRHIAPTNSYSTQVRQDPTDDTMTGFCRACHSVGPQYHFFGLCFGCHTGHRKGWELRGSF